MALTATAGGPSRHPWLDEFARTPQQAFGDLLAGYARIFPYDRADAPDAAKMLFGGLSADDPLRPMLGRAILDWLESRRGEAPPPLRPQLQRWIRGLCEAFEIVALLELTDAAVALRRRFVVLNEWVARFSLSSSRDARAEYWRMLALTQPLVGSAQAIDPNGLVPFWLELCSQAGGVLPSGYLSIGLLGLRRIPPSPAGSEAPWVAGLAHWALARDPSKDEFTKAWRGLKPLYPRTDARWSKLVCEVLSAKVFRDAGVSAPAWWRIDSGVARLAQSADRPLPASNHLEAPSEKDADALVQTFDEPWQRVEPRVDRLMARHRRYAVATGDSYYFVRALHRVGRALIEHKGDRLAERARKAQALAREGLSCGPYDKFLWSLWRDALRDEGEFDAAELVGWEAIRRDPNDVDKRNQIATLIASVPGRSAEAESVLRDSVATFPGDRFARTQLANLLADLGRIEEARAVLKTAIAEGVADDKTLNMAAQLRDRPHAGAQQRPHRTSDVRHPESAQRSPRPGDPALESAMRFGRLRRLRFRTASIDPAVRQAALLEVQDILHADRWFGYAEIIGARHGFRHAEDDDLPSFAVAFEQALAGEDREKLEELAKSQPRLKALTLLARALLGDAAAAITVDELLRGAAPAQEPRAVTVLRDGFGLMSERFASGSVLDLLAANRNAVLGILHDANEAGLGDRLLAA